MRPTATLQLRRVSYDYEIYSCCRSMSRIMYFTADTFFIKVYTYHVAIRASFLLYPTTYVYYECTFDDNYHKQR